MSLEQFLGQRYRLTSRLPAFGTTHQRYVVQGTSGTPEEYVLSFCDYSKSLTMDALAKQRRVAEVMMRPPVGLLCRVVDFELKAEYQCVVSEYPGDYSLRELLQQRQSLSMEEVEAFLRLLTEACEAATALGWPKLHLDAAHLFLDTRLGLPRIPAPDIPIFDNAGSGTQQYDPMATIQFNAADLRAAVDPLPKDTHDYVLPLAALTCDLLGQPQHMRGGNARYQPVPQLTSQQNVLLRRALTSEGRATFNSAKSFMDEFFGVSMHHSIVAHTERLRTLTSPGTRSASHAAAAAAAAAPPVATPDSLASFSSATVRRPGPPPLPPMRPPGPVTSVLSVSARDREAAEKAPPMVRLRLVPDSEEAPIFTLVGEETMILGRSAADADFIAQFRPRSNMNDARSRRVSRAQTKAQIKDGKLVLEESVAVNPSVLQDAPIPGFAQAELPVNFLLAGEYPMEVRAMPSDYDKGREVSGWGDVENGRLQGGIILRPGGSGVLLCEAAVVFSDVGLHFSKSGRPWLRADASAMPVARVHRFAGQFWLEPIEPSVVAIASGTEVRTKAHDMVLLTEGSKVRLGPYGYSVQSYTLPASDSAQAAQPA